MPFRHHKATLSDCLHCPVWRLVIRRRRQDHNVSLRKVFRHRVVRPRGRPRRVADHRKRPADVPLNAQERVQVRLVTKPQHFIASAVRRFLWVLVGVRNDHRVGEKVVMLDPPRHRLGRTRRHMRQPAEPLVFRKPLEMVVAEISHHRPAGINRPHGNVQFARHRLGKHQHIRRQVVDGRAHKLGRNCRTVAVARHRLSAAVDERHPHAGSPIFFRCRTIAASRPSPLMSNVTPGNNL